jgi:hypothetical protein
MISGIPGSGTTAHEFVNSPLPFRRTPSHICLKPAGAGDDRGRLTDINAIRGNPMKMP